MLEFKPGSHEVRGSIPLGSTNLNQREGTDCESGPFSRINPVRCVVLFVTGRVSTRPGRFQEPLSGAKRNWVAQKEANSWPWAHEVQTGSGRG